MSKQRNEGHWEDVLRASDKEAYQQVVEPYIQDLLRVAREDLEYYVSRGFLHEDDFTPEEVVGEALIHAWQHRNVRPSQMSLRGWMAGTQYRVMRGMVNDLRSYRRDKSLSLDEPVPDNADAHDTEEWFWDWYQPDRELIWEDVIPSQEPQDVEVSLEEDERERLLEETDERHALIMHGEFEMSLPEVAFSINQSPIAVAEVLQKARVGMSARGGRDQEETEHPNPRSDG